MYSSQEDYISAMYHQTSNKRCILEGNNCWSLRCSWSISCWHCSNYNFILNLTPGFNGLDKDKCKTRQKTFKFWDLMCLILEVSRQVPGSQNHVFSTSWELSIQFAISWFLLWLGITWFYQHFQRLPQAVYTATVAILQMAIDTVHPPCRIWVKLPNVKTKQNTSHLYNS